MCAPLQIEVLVALPCRDACQLICMLPKQQTASMRTRPHPSRDMVGWDHTPCTPCNLMVVINPCLHATLALCHSTIIITVIMRAPISFGYSHLRHSTSCLAPRPAYLLFHRGSRNLATCPRTRPCFSTLTPQIPIPTPFAPPAQACLPAAAAPTPLPAQQQGPQL